MTLYFESEISGKELQGMSEQELVHIKHDSISDGSGYVVPAALVEFGARFTGEP